MIGWVSGRIIDREPPGKLVINVHGVGYEVETSLQTFFKLEAQEEEVDLYIYTVVREDAFLLYGFLHREERDLFKALIKVNGIGPKMAMTVLSSTNPQEFIQSIQEQDTALLTRLPGIGKKTAERLILEMKDRLQALPPRSFKSIPGDSPTQTEAIQALQFLGYKQGEAAKAVKQVAENHKNCEQLIRDALQWLAGH